MEFLEKSSPLSLTCFEHIIIIKTHYAGTRKAKVSLNKKESSRTGSHGKKVIKEVNKDE